MDLILHYDPELDLEFEIPELDPTGYANIPSFLEAHEAEVNEAILSALHTAVEMELGHVPTFAVMGVEEVFLIKREEFENQVQRLLPYYSELEEFELCIVLKELENQLQVKKDS